MVQLRSPLTFRIKFRDTIQGQFLTASYGIFAIINCVSIVKLMTIRL
jgi:hypothetical protein